MIKATIEWSSDIEAAPRGETVTKVTTFTRDGKQQQRTLEEFVPTRILALSRCGKVISSHWIPPRYTQSEAVLDGDRWHGFNRGAPPVMWALWPNGEALLAGTLAHETHAA